VCERHWAEDDYASQPTAKKWPIAVDFSSLTTRILALRPKLDELWIDPHDNHFYKGIQLQIGTLGRQHAFSLLGEYEASTERKCSTGYFGDRGAGIFMQALRTMYPPVSDCHGVSYNDFLRRVMIPEVAVLLCQADMDMDPTDALEVIHASHTWGLA
ncbi:hypothetical protein OF83DRAFT_1039049, partial [Amylostereum chailletii]